MIQTVEAVVDANGLVRLLGSVDVASPRRALVTVLEEPAAVPGETALLSEAALRVDWSRPEEEEAWSYFKRRSSPDCVSVLGFIAIQGSSGHLPGGCWTWRLVTLSDHEQFVR